MSTYNLQCSHHTKEGQMVLSILETVTGRGVTFVTRVAMKMFHTFYVRSGYCCCVLFNI